MVVMLAFGGIGYLMKKYQYDAGPSTVALTWKPPAGDGPAPVPDHLPRRTGHLRQASVGPRVLLIALAPPLFPVPPFGKKREKLVLCRVGLTGSATRKPRPGRQV